MFKLIFNRIRVLYLLFVIVLFEGCNSNSTKNNFTSDFNTTSQRTWIGPEYWSNPLQDWNVENGELNCLVSDKNRNVHLLTKKIDSNSGTINTSVQIKVHQLIESKKNENWVGFSIGSKGEFNDFRDNAIFGKGLNAGVTTRGDLFIGTFEQKTSKPLIKNVLKRGVVLAFNYAPFKSNFKITLSLFDITGKKLLNKIEKELKPSETIHGDIVLVSHYNLKKSDKRRLQKSVSFSNWQVSGSKISTYNDYKFGPILFSQYTLSRKVLKLTAQMAPVILGKEKVYLEIKKENKWIVIDSSSIDKDARTATFNVFNWKAEKNIPYRVSYKIDKGIKYKEQCFWEGMIRKDPVNKEEFVVAGFTGNDHLGFPNSDITKQVAYHNPDLLFFSGDQIYEPSGGFGVQRSPYDKATLDYLRKWYMFGWAFRDLMKDRPTISITDDHDVYHGNIWGAGGIATPKEYGQGAKAQDAGGYKMPPKWVNMVQKTQTSHFPNPFDPTPVKQGINTYYTDMDYGGVSFAILEDRKFKSAPKGLLPKANIWNGWAQNKKFDMKTEGDVKGATLLGDRQLLFLNHWVSDWSEQTTMKMLLSQTIFANVATLPKEAMSGAIIPTLRIMHEGDYAENDRPVADLDSNGWPQTGRNKALKIIRKAFAVHLAGDQHLGSTIQYGIDDWGDGGFALCVPSISNHWPRRWYPLENGINRDPNKPKYTGEFEDGFGNKMTVYAVSNPTFTDKKPSRLHDRATGYGIVRLNKRTREIILECWPRSANPANGNKDQYKGWPITIKQEQNYGRKAASYLPELRINGVENPIVQVIDETINEILYTIRINGKTFKPKVFNKSHTYTLKIGLSTNNFKIVKRNLSPLKKETFLVININE
ncbi:MAG: alkaline phosphatase D family protein [Flavobacteriaceae bacterium]|nr:alkaline phosphatase D family protein [Flavobacteriaceae bacterium]